MRGFVAILALAALAPTLASAQAKPPANYVPADWIRRPTSQSLLSVWPREAMRKGVDGEAVITCKISEQGALFGCKVKSQSPESMGFGEAAIALTPQLLMKPATVDGKPVVSEVTLPIRFVGPGQGSTGTHIGGSNSFAKTVITNVAWTAAPTYSQVAGVYPKEAATDRLGGRATISCTLKDDGGLRNCTTVTEEPRGEDFAEAAKRLAPLFRAPTSFSDGSPTAGANAHIVFVFTPEMLDPARRIIGKVQWARTPTGDAFMAGYPQAAKDAGVRTGRVVMACEAGAGGKLDNCSMVSEEPAGLGFGAAALSLSPSFHVRPWTAEGLPVIGGKIRVPVRYQIPEAAPAAPAKP